MDQIFVLLGIVIWVIGTVAKAARAMKGSTIAPPPPSRPIAPLRAVRPTAPPSNQPPSGYAGRGVGERNPDQSRAMSAASPRLAAGAEYGPIVAERAADRAAELRFAQEAQQLIDSEPKTSSVLQSALSSPKVNNEIGRLNITSGSLINAIILSEVLGQPRSKIGFARQLRR